MGQDPWQVLIVEDDERLAELTASATSLPSFTCGNAAEIGEKK